MHILFLSDNFPPEVNAPASRTLEHCREWVKAGHKVTVITCAPNFPKGKLFDGYKNKLWQSEEMSGIRIIRVWTYITSNEGFAKRILDYISFMIAATIASLFVRRVDIIVGTSPQFFTACAAWAVSILKWRPWIFELRDIWPESIRVVNAMENSRLLNMMEKLELFLYKRANAIISVTHSFKRNLIERGIDGSKIHVITNGVDLERFTPMKKDISLVKKLDLEGKFVAGYVGTHGLAHGLDTLINAAQILANDPQAKDFRILMLGDGANRHSLKNMAFELGLTNIIFIDSVPKEAVAHYWSLLDVSIIHLIKSKLFTSVIPSKLFECMAMGIPVLHGVKGESADIVKSNEIGLTFEPQDATALVAGLKLLKQDETLKKRLGKNGILAARKFDRLALAKDMLIILQTVADQ